MVAYKKRPKKFIIAVAIVVLIIAGFSLHLMGENYLKREAHDIKPTLALQGASTINLTENEAYEEPGFSAYNADGEDITDKVTVEGKVDTTKQGNYSLQYQVKDRYGNKSETKTRTIIVSECDGIPRREAFEKERPQLKEHLETVIAKNEDTLFNLETECEQTQFLMEFIKDYYGEKNLPPRGSLNELINELLE